LLALRVLPVAHGGSADLFIQVIFTKNALFYTKEEEK